MNTFPTNEDHGIVERSRPRPRAAGEALVDEVLWGEQGVQWYMTDRHDPRPGNVEGDHETRGRREICCLIPPSSHSSSGTVAWPAAALASHSLCGQLTCTCAACAPLDV